MDTPHTTTMEVPHHAPHTWGRVDAPLDDPTKILHRFDPWHVDVAHTHLADTAGRDLRQAFTADRGAFHHRRLYLDRLAEFHLHGKGWTRHEADHGIVVWQGPDRLPPVWIVGTPMDGGWRCHPSLWLGEGQDPHLWTAHRRLLDGLDSFDVVDQRGNAHHGAVLPWWLLPALPTQDSPPTTQAVDRVLAAAHAFTSQLHHVHQPPWLHMDAPTAQDGVPSFPHRTWRLTRDREGRRFGDPGDHVQARAVGMPALDALWRAHQPTPNPLDRLTLPQSTSRHDATWAWALPNPSDASAHVRLGRHGVWRMAAAMGLASSPGTALHPPPDTAPFGATFVAPNTGGRHGPMERAERALSGAVRDGRITARDGMLFLTGHPDAERLHTPSQRLRLWSWAQITGPAVALMGWKADPREEAWRIHPGLVRVPDEPKRIDLDALAAHADASPATVDRATLREGLMLPWWALGAQEPVLTGMAQSTWATLESIVHSFLIEGEDREASITLCPPQHRDYRLVWAKPILHRHGPSGALHTRFERILLPLAERFLHQPGCLLQPGHVARAVWRMVGAPAPFPAPITHPQGPLSAHRRMLMASTWDALLRRRW